MYMGHQVDLILFPERTVQRVGDTVQQEGHQHYAAE